MKKLLSVLFSLLFVFTFAFVAGCGQKEELTQSELAQLYKTIAQKSWEMLGAGDPTKSDTSTLSVKTTGITIADETEEASSEDSLFIKANGASSMALVNMIGEFYEREEFILNDKLSTVSVTNPEAPEETGLVSVIAEIDKADNYVYIELVLEVGGVTACYFFEINFDFDKETLISYRLIYYGNESFNDQQIREDGKVYFASTKDVSETVINDATAMYNDLLSRKVNANICSGDFTNEFARYMEYSQKAFYAVASGAQNS